MRKPTYPTIPVLDDVAALNVPSGYAEPTFGSLFEWIVLGARCASCEREGWLDRWELARMYGKDQIINDLRPRLRCRKCGNKSGNKFIAGKMER